MIIPILMILHNRIEYSKKAVNSLMNIRGGLPFIFENGSTDKTKEWLILMDFKPKIPIIYFSDKNIGIHGAMNFFLKQTSNYKYCCKIDNDTIVQPDFIESMLPHMKHADVVQARHPILKETHPKGFDEWVKNMPSKGALRFNHFVGGSPILFRRDKVNSIPETEWVLGPWREFQKQNPKLKKAFATNVTAELLDTDENGKKYPIEYTEYYKSTGRI